MVYGYPMRERISGYKNHITLTSERDEILLGNYARTGIVLMVFYILRFTIMGIFHDFIIRSIVFESAFQYIPTELCL